MTTNPLVEQAKQGNVNAISSLMNRLLKSQAMLANVEREGDRLDILIESDLRSLGSFRSRIDFDGNTGKGGILGLCFGSVIPLFSLICRFS